MLVFWGATGNLGAYGTIALKIAVYDVVAAAKTNLEGGIYNIGSPKRVSLEEMKRGNNQGLFPKR